ncbi:MAG: ATP synthase F1 subunit gamma [Patescibacteria group bacterium]|nr:ATP synthase F1 subunit gamma [Patescibacteria group bacterium]
MATSKEIRRRIKSVRSTRQITKAMQLVSAVKMRSAQRTALASRTYAKLSWALLQQLAQVTPEHLHPLLTNRTKVAKEAVVVITANRGLAGSFNAALIEHVAAYLRGRVAAGVACDIILLGKRGRALVTRYGFSVVAEYERLDSYTDMAQTLPIARQAIKDFLEKRYDQVTLAYTEFYNTLKQEPLTVTLLPTKVSALKAAMERTVGALGTGQEPEHIFEPTPQLVLDALLPRCIEMQVYQATLESSASEHSARMVAMKNATDAANDLISDLTLSYNQLRQAGITRELTEISAGRLALEK